MKKWLRIFGTLLLFGLFLSACSYFRAEKKAWNPDGTFIIEAPSYLHKNSKLSEGAALQLGNLDKDLFFVLRKTPLDSLESKFPEAQLSDYFILHQDNLLEKLESPSVTGPDSLKTAFMDGVSGNIVGGYDGNLLHHKLILLKDSLYCFQILYWMPEKLWDTYEADLNEMVNSLHAQ
ncbi:MAG: hypothetical protein MRZ79_17870 [Bacteroidia bacterium]|nr:hypothetical protein [Bacteroidia bacterium]